MKKFVKYLPLVLVLILAFILRFYNYAQFPVSGETADERAWTLIGSSLIQNGKPSSWSYFKAYEEFNAVVQNEVEPIVSPALDHPPLFALIPGLAHSLKASWDQMPSIKVIRLPMVLIGTLNVLLLYLVAQKLFNNKKLALMTALIYASAPIFVFASRLIVAENLLITWMLLSVYLTLTNYKKKYLFLFLLSILSILSKFSGVVIPVALFLYGLKTRDKKTMLAASLGLIGGILAFFIYGAIYNWPLFWAIFSSQSGREIGFFTFYNRFFIHPAVVYKLFTDGWLILGLLASFLLIAIEKNKNFVLIKTLLLTNLLFILASVGQQTFHAWYDYLWYPIFALSIGYLFNLIFKNKNYLLFALSYLLLLPLLQILFLEIKFTPLSLINRLILALSLLPMLVSYFAKLKLNNFLLKVNFVLLIIINIVVILNFSQTLYWETDSFLFYR